MELEDLIEWLDETRFQQLIELFCNPPPRALSLDNQPPVEYIELIERIETDFEFSAIFKVNNEDYFKFSGSANSWSSNWYDEHNFRPGQVYDYTFKKVTPVTVSKIEYLELE